MKFEWIYLARQTTSLNDFLKTQGLSKIQLAKIKFQGGALVVNHHLRHSNYLLHRGNVIDVFSAPEIATDSLVPDFEPLTIIYEDAHFLVVDKPAGVASIPAPQHPDNTMANRVKGYLQRTKSESQSVHLVTRLDRDTSGLMLFTKHGYAHALMDRQRHTGQLKKYYLAATAIPFPDQSHGWIMLPIARTREFYMRRQVQLGGKKSVTEFWVTANQNGLSWLRVALHTGRTHQIRVHFAGIGHPLAGDELYGGDRQLIQRQALHCQELQFFHPFLQRNICLTSALPEDLKKLQK